MKRLSIAATGLRSLQWDGEELVDLVGGGARFRLDGRAERAHVSYAYDFDAALVGPDGWSVVYTRLGTKALLLRHGRIERELDRSYYQAQLTPYPIALVKRGQRTIVAQGTEYDRLELFDAGSGACLSKRETKPPDFFQSRLCVSADGRWLASAGWVWHPFECVRVHDLSRALEDPRLLDERDPHPALLEVFDHDTDAASAAFDPSGRLVFCLMSDGASRIGVYDPQAEAILSLVPCAVGAGTILALGDDHAVVVTDCPRLVRLSDGAVVHAFSDLPTTEPLGCIDQRDPGPRVPLALDPAGRRFAVAGPEEITVIELGR